VIDTGRRRFLATLALLGVPMHDVHAQANPGLLVFTRTAGYRHDSIPDGVDAIRALGVAHGVAVDQSEDLSGIEDGNLARYAALVLLSTTGNFLEPPQQAALQRYVQRGGGVVGIHGASDADYGWPWYGGLIGAFFDSHPDIQMASVNVEEAGDLATAGLPEPWVRTDEWYNFRTNPRDAGVQVLLTLDESSYSGGSMGADHPIAWYHAYDGGRAWYTAGGHTSESFADPLFRAHLWGGIAYAANLA
jgi:type 1 glutamine amidotransferase